MIPEPWLRQTCAERVGAFVFDHEVLLSAPWTAIFGPSGTGKSTWLRMLAGLLPQRTGSLTLLGRELRTVPTHKRRIALVEQSPALFPHRTVEDNVAFGCTSDPGHAEFLAGVLDSFHLTALKRANIRALSGGERQRVAIARALCSRPRALLLDEVFTGMDAALRDELVSTLQGWQQRLNLPILSITHDVGEVFATADEVLRMRNGNFVAQSSPAEVLVQDREDLLKRLRPHTSP